MLGSEGLITDFVEYGTVLVGTKERGHGLGVLGDEKGSILLGRGEHSAKVDTAPIFILTPSFLISLRF